MKNEYVNATRSKILSALKAEDISRRLDNMDIYREYNYILLGDAKEASKTDPRTPRSTICCRVYVTNKSGVYGYQYMAAIWINVDGQWHHASGSLTGGCGYDKISTAVESAFRAIGLDSKIVDHFGGTGQHERIMEELMEVLAGRKAWFKV